MAIHATGDPFALSKAIALDCTAILGDPWGQLFHIDGNPCLVSSRNRVFLVMEGVEIPVWTCQTKRTYPKIPMAIAKPALPPTTFTTPTRFWDWSLVTDF
jgi:hypothetical protein